MESERLYLLLAKEMKTVYIYDAISVSFLI